MYGTKNIVEGKHRISLVWGCFLLLLLFFFINNNNNTQLHILIQHQRSQATLSDIKQLHNIKRQLIA